MKEWRGKVLYSYPKIKNANVKDIPLPTLVQPKYDGELNFLYFEKSLKKWVTVNKWGHYRTDYRITHLAQKLLDPKKIYVGELCCGNSLYSLLRNKDPSKLSLKIFDILTNPSERIIPYQERVYNEKSLTNLARLNGSSLMRVPLMRVNDRDTLMRLFQGILVIDYEGIVCRHPTLSKMWKIKRVRTYDVVILGISKKGKSFERGEIGSLLVGIYSRKERKFKTVGKIGMAPIKSFSDSFIPLISMSNLLKSKIREDSDYIYVKPKIVLEIYANAILPSKKYDLGLSFRHPRFKRFLFNKNPKDCTEEQFW